MKLEAGLAGQAVSGHTTEIKIWLYAETTVEASLQIRDGMGLLTMPVMLDELQSKTLWLPVTPNPLGTIKVSLITNEGQIIRKELGLQLNRSVLTLISRTSAMVDVDHFQPLTDIIPAIISAQGMPHTTQGYAAIETIITDAPTLSRLSSSQYQALSNYLSHCNILLLTETSPEILAELRSIAGCAGHFIHRYDRLSSIPSLLLRLNSQRSPRLPTAQELRPFWQGAFKARISTALSLYLSGYLLFVAFAVWRIRKTHYLLLLPIIFSVTGILAWTGSGDNRLFSWSEAVSGDPQLRSASLLLLGGERRGPYRAAVGAHVQLSTVDKPSAAGNMGYQPQGQMQILSGKAQLLSPQSYRLTSITQQALPFSLTLKEGQPLLKYLGGELADSPRLLWRGLSYRIPPLAAGNHWQPNKNLGQATSSEEERLLNRRLSLDEPALLLKQPLDIKIAGIDSGQSSGWLVIRQQPGAAQ